MAAMISNPPNILIVDDLAYLSCGFGIVVVNLEKKEIKDTYLRGENGGFLNVFDMTTDGVMLFAATEEGIYEANLNNTNPVPFLGQAQRRHAAAESRTNDDPVVVHSRYIDSEPSRKSVRSSQLFTSTGTP